MQTTLARVLTALVDADLRRLADGRFTFRPKSDMIRTIQTLLLGRSVVDDATQLGWTRRLSHVVRTRVDAALDSVALGTDAVVPNNDFYIFDVVFATFSTEWDATPQHVRRQLARRATEEVARRCRGSGALVAGAVAGTAPLAAPLAPLEVGVPLAPPPAAQALLEQQIRVMQATIDRLQGQGTDLKSIIMYSTRKARAERKHRRRSNCKNAKDAA